jgi:hypothetical protein
MDAVELDFEALKSVPAAPMTAGAQTAVRQEKGRMGARRLQGFPLD